MRSKNILFLIISTVLLAAGSCWALSNLPDPGTQNFSKNTRAVFGEWKAAIDSLDASVDALASGGTGGTHVSAYQSVAQTLPAATWTKILFQAEEKDTLGEFASSTFTAASTGYYSFFTGITLYGYLSSSEVCLLELRVNSGSNIRISEFAVPANNEGGIYGATELYLTAGDSVDVWIHPMNTNDTLPSNRYTWLKVSNPTGVSGLVQGAGIEVDNSNPSYPVISANSTLTATHIRATSSASLSLSANVWTKVVFDVEEKDALGEFSSSTFTAANDGYYNVFVNIGLSNPVASTFVIAIYKNGAVLVKVSDSPIEASYQLADSGSDQIYLSAGDTVEIYVFSSVAATVSDLDELTHIAISRD